MRFTFCTEGQVVETERQGQARQEQPPGRGSLEHTGLNASICARWGGGGMGEHQEASWGHKSDLSPAQESRETEASQGRTRKRSRADRSQWNVRTFNHS